MSVIPMSWVLRFSDERLGNRLVLLALADHAHADGTKAWPSVETLGDEARLSERQVRACLRSLEKNGSIVKTGVSPKGTSVYTIVMPEGGSIRPPAESDSARSDSAPEPPVNHPPTTTTARGRARAKKAEVDGKPVTPAEDETSRAILAAFNDEFGTRFTSKHFLRGVVMRIRDHPELSLADHAALIAKAKRNPWWKDDPSPAVVYGNDAVFDRVLNQKDKPAGPDLSVYDG